MYKKALGIILYSQDFANPAQKGMELWKIFKTVPGEKQMDVLHWLLQEAFQALGKDNFSSAWNSDHYWAEEWLEAHFEESRAQTLLFSVRGLLDRAESNPNVVNAVEYLLVSMRSVHGVDDSIAALLLGFTLYTSLLPFAVQFGTAPTAVEDNYSRIAEQYAHVLRQLEHADRFDVPDHQKQFLLGHILAQIPDPHDRQALYDLHIAGDVEVNFDFEVDD